MHTSNIDSETGKRFCQLYRLSDKKKHDFAFTFVVIDGIVNCEDFSLTDCDCLRFKSDNCFCQYKLKNTFANWSQLPWLTSKNVIVYFGVIGNLVDATSSFGVKRSLGNAIITGDFLPLKICISAYDIYKYLCNCNNHDNRKYILLKEEINWKSMSDQEIIIKFWQKQYMITFFPDGPIPWQESIYFWERCLTGIIHNNSWQE